MKKLFALTVAVVALTGCGVGAGSLKPRSSAEALITTAEVLEFETPTSRRELFVDLARTSQLQTGSTGAVLFPVMRSGDLVAAEGLDVKADLLQVPDAGTPVVLNFEAGAAGFADDRRESLQGLSEREAAELIARSLLTKWKLPMGAAVQVERTPGVPYAVAYIDGVLRINPAFVYMAAAPVGP